MATRIGALFVDLSLNTAKFISELDKSRTKSATFGVAVGTIMANVAQSLVRMVKDAALALPRLVVQQIDLADQMNKASQQTGIQVEALSALRHAAELSDVGFEQLITGIGRLSRNMVDTARGVGESRVAFRELGIEVKDAGGNIRPIQDVLGDVADRFAGLTDGAQQTTLALQLFGRGGQALIPLLNKGRESLAELTAEAERLGLVISAETAQAAEDFNDNMTRLRSAVGGLALQIAAEVLPSFVNLTNAFVNTASEGGRVKTIGQEIGVALKGATQFALTAALGVFGFVGALSQLAEEIQSIELGIAKALNAIRPKSLQADLTGLEKGLKEREERTLAIADAVQFVLDLMNAVDESAVKAGAAMGGIEPPDIENKELDKFIESFEKAARPADELNDRIVKLIGAGKSASDVMRVFGDEITAAVAAQRSFGKPIQEQIALLAEQIELRRQTVDGIRSELEALARLKAAPAILEAWRLAAEELPQAFAGATVSVEGLGDAFEALLKIDPIGTRVTKDISEVDEAFERMGLRSGFALSGLADQAREDFFTILASGQASAEQIAEAFVETQESIKAAAESGFGTWTEEQEKALTAGRNELEKFRDKTDAIRDGMEDLAHVIGTAFEDAVLRGGELRDVLAGILEDIGRIILRATVTKPLENFFGGLADAIGGTLGGIGAGANVPVHLAKGGSISSNATAFVGEMGSRNKPMPELFITDEFLKQLQVRGTDGASMPKFPAFDAVMKTPEMSPGKPFLVGKHGPEIFKPPAPGTIVPLDSPQGAKLYTRMKELGLTREFGGHVSPASSFMVGEKRTELFLPDSSQRLSGAGINLNISIDARGAQQGVGREIARTMRKLHQKIVQDSLAASQELNRRKA
jgi:hypothetical protein